MPLPEHTVRLPQGIVIIDGKPLIDAWALTYLLSQLSDQDCFEMHNYADADPAQYCERATEWLLEHGKVSV
jgi:hypothetical protein